MKLSEQLRALASTVHTQELIAPLREMAKQAEALEQHPVGVEPPQPVAFEWRNKGTNEPWSYVDFTDGKLIQKHPDKYEVRPLYAHPPVSQLVVGVDKLVEMAMRVVWYTTGYDKEVSAMLQKNFRKDFAVALASRPAPVVDSPLSTNPVVTSGGKANEAPVLTDEEDRPLAKFPRENPEEARATFNEVMAEHEGRYKEWLAGLSGAEKHALIAENEERILQEHFFGPPAMERLRMMAIAQEHREAIATLSSPPAEAPSQGWISVKERLPKDNQTVWLANPKHGIVFLGCVVTEDEGWCWAKSNGTTYIEGGAIVSECEADDYEVTHWMPLPPPPDTN